jgi:hypothetical protein
VRAFPLFLLTLTTACSGTTGGDVFSFRAVARGPAGVENGRFELDTGRGYHVTLERARLRLGALYLNRTVPTSVSADTTCTLPGGYVAEVTSGIVLDVLAGVPVDLPEPGLALAERALTGEVWLTGGDVNDPNDSEPVIELGGTAELDGTTYPFEGALSIGQNRVVDPPSATPGAKPICKERIVAPIPVDLVPREGGRLLVEVAPGAMLEGVDFSTLLPDPGGIYRFDDDPSSATVASNALYQGLHATTAYHFDWIEGNELENSR